MLALMAPLFLVSNPLGWTRSSPAALREQLAAMQLDPESLGSWEEAEALHHALRSIGVAPPDLSAVGARLEAAIDADLDGHPTVWACALRMGLIDAEHRATLAQQPDAHSRLEQLRNGTASLRGIRYSEYLIRLLADELAKAPKLRRQLAEQLVQRWPSGERHGALQEALVCVNCLDAIGESERADGLRERCWELLVRHWVANNTSTFGVLGGFTSDPLKFRTSFDGQTWYAVQLMERFGVPPQIDLRLLRGHLRTESRALFFDDSFELRALSRASLRLLEDKIGLPPRSPLQRLFDERLLVAALLLVGLCLLAIRLAPSFEPDAVHGARP